MKSFYSWYKKHITQAIFTGLVLGILTGLFLAGRYAPVLTVTSLIGGIYMNALNMMIFPMVFCSIVIGICSIGNIRTTGKITGSAMVYFLSTTALASLVGLIIPRLIHLGRGVSFEMATADIQATEMSSILDTIKNLIPSNPVKAFAEGNMLQVLVFAVIIGFTLISIGEKGKPFLDFIDSLNEICLKIIGTIMYFTPIGVFCTYRSLRQTEQRPSFHWQHSSSSFMWHFSVLLFSCMVCLSRSLAKKARSASSKRSCLLH